MVCVQHTRTQSVTYASFVSVSLVSQVVRCPLLSFLCVPLHLRHVLVSSIPSQGQMLEPVFFSDDVDVVNVSTSRTNRFVLVEVRKLTHAFQA